MTDKIRVHMLRAGKTFEGTTEEVIEKYRRYIQGKPELLAALPELAGKRLGCYCKPEACHGDVLVELLMKRTDE